MNKKTLLLLAVSGFVIALDQACKIYVHTHFHVGDSVEVFSGFFNLTYVRNYGAAFGFLAKAPETFRDYFFLTIPPLVLTLVLLVFRSIKDNDIWQIVALSSIFGGAIGNYIDRLRFGFVVDFVDIHFYDSYSWPAFNIADSAIVLGIGVVLVYQFLPEQEEEVKK